MLRDELISQFKNLNDVLRSEGLRAGIERVSEFVNILFLKLLSEDSQKSWWNSIKSQSNDDIIGYINGYVIEQIQNKYGGDVFTAISIKNPQTLRYIIDAIDPLVLSDIDTDIKGDVFEYFLEKTSSTENDLGEYFTPRNIVTAIINLVDPKFEESIYDPFCGTGGLLIEAFNYIKKENKERILNNYRFYGREITSTARIAKMNMILHGDGHSGIQQINTLTNPDYILPNGEIKKFDVVVTNMPFSQTITRKTTENGKIKIENVISPLYYNGIAKNNGDSACVLHCLRALKEGGRMALVVPEGFLFRKDIANVRKFLLSKAKLQSVISLPQGTFLPYTGVKTDILYFTDAHKPNNQKHYWFFEAKNIGVTLDNHKRKIKGDNDLKKIESSDIKKVDKKPDLQDNMLEIGFEIIDLDKVKNNDYNLVGSLYKESKNQSSYEKQQKVVEELDSYQKIIDGAKQIIDNWKPAINSTLHIQQETERKMIELQKELIKTFEDKILKYQF
jgi:type I restriction enzyme M protein